MHHDLCPSDADMFQHGARQTRFNMAAADACIAFGILITHGFALDALCCEALLKSAI